MTEELKSCPFCGSKSISVTHNSTAYNRLKLSTVSCGCGASFFDYESEAIKSWNTRTKDATIKELIDGFKFAYENGSFYPEAVEYLAPIYEKHIANKEDK